MTTNTAQTYQETIQVKGNPLIMLICLIVILFGSAKIYYDPLFSLQNFLIGLATLGFTLYLFWFLTGKVLLKIDQTELSIEKQFLSLRFSKIYLDLQNITKLKKEENVEPTVKTNVFSVGTANIWYKSDSVKKLENHPVVIYFQYNNNSRQIGKGLAAFNADEIIKQIHLRQRPTADK
jgi:energy-coupling factor transporter transmembrane protein EcfT